MGMFPADIECAGLAGNLELELGGTPCLDNEKAFIFACISCEKPLDFETSGGGWGGLRAVYTLSRGVEELLMLRDIGGSAWVRSEDG
jgi:hypothetical protein